MEVIDYPRHPVQRHRMSRFSFGAIFVSRPASFALLTAALISSGVMSEAACYVHYKAKRDNPLNLHYGVMEFPSAPCQNRQAQIAQRIAVDGWELLTIMGELTRDEAMKRKADAGAFFLRY